MYQQLRGDGLIAFSDPAGAKACLALATMLLKDEPDRNIRLFSNRFYPFYADWPVEVIVTDEAPDAPANWLFTGTSHPESSGGYEPRAITAAKRRGIPTWALIDHWTGLALRFDQDGGPVYPDHVVVLDQVAAEKAAAEGIPGDLLRIHPNPYLEYIRDYWAPSLSKPQLLDLIGVGAGYDRLLLYAADPLSLRNADGAWKFDEGDVLLDLVEILNDIPGTALVIKAHQLQPDAAWTRACSAADEGGITLHFITNSVDPLELMQAADLIIGIQSNFLIEADALHRPILRYFPASAERDAIAHLAIGAKIESREELAAAIRAGIADDKGQSGLV